MTEPVRKVCIAGAGIGGLTLAIALRKVGIDAHVYERTAALKPVGAGLSLMPNAMLALRAIGVDEAVRKVGEPAGESFGLRSDGAELQRFPIGEIAREMGTVALLLHRADLHAALLEALGAAHVTLDRPVKGYRDDARGAALVFEDGSEAEADVVVGADGLRSVIRRQLLGDDREPVYSGYTSWRGVTDTLCGATPRQLSETWGKGERFGIAPVGRDRVYWFAVVNAPPGGRDASDARPALLARFGKWHAPIPSLIEATPAERIVRTDIADRPVVTTWCRGRVALLGDAAHPTTPNLGQGGCQAIEDAVALSGALATWANPAAAFEAYERVRVARANKLVEDARRFGALAHSVNPAFLFVREALLKWTPHALVRRNFQSIFRYEDPFKDARCARTPL